MLSQEPSPIGNPCVKTDLILTADSTDTSRLRLDQGVKSLDFYHSTEEGTWLIELFCPKSQLSDEISQALVLQFKPNPNCIQKFLTVDELALSLEIDKANLYLLVFQILENKSRKCFLLVAQQFEGFFTRYQDKEEQQYFIETYLLDIQQKIITLASTLRVDLYSYILSYCPFTGGLEQIAFKPLELINRIELKPAIEQAAQNLNVQSQTHSQHCTIEVSATECEDNGRRCMHANSTQAFQKQQASVLSQSGGASEFLHKIIKYKWSDGLRLFGFRLIPLLALTIVLGFFAQKQITIRRLWSAVDHAKGQIDSPTRIRAMQELVKLGQPLNNIPLHKANLKSTNFSGANFNGAFLDQANLNAAFLNRTNLNGANLYKANLSGAFLNGAFLNGAFLNQTNLSGAFLNKAFLSGVFLENAFLNGTKLVSANLNGAKLASAKLVSANLNGAKLVGANLDGANLVGTNLDGANLYGASFNDTQFGCTKSYTNETICTNLTNAKNLTPQQVKQAKNWQIGIYDPQFRKKLGLAPEAGN